MYASELDTSQLWSVAFDIMMTSTSKYNVHTCHTYIHWDVIRIMHPLCARMKSLLVQTYIYTYIRTSLNSRHIQTCTHTLHVYTVYEEYTHKVICRSIHSFNCMQQELCTSHIPTVMYSTVERCNPPYVTIAITSHLADTAKQRHGWSSGFPACLRGDG